MGILDFIILGVLAVLFILALRYAVRHKGCKGCGGSDGSGGCEGCGKSDGCDGESNGFLKKAFQKLLSDRSRIFQMGLHLETA